MRQYDRYFEISAADNAEQLVAAFRLRYQVYCVENSFEDAAANPLGMETDAYDCRALHSLLLRRSTGEVLGTVRLILPLSVYGGKRLGLPIRAVCDHALIDCNNPDLPWATTAEISRFAVSKKATGQKPTVSNGMGHRAFHTSLGLMQAVVAMAARAGVTHVCAVMEPSLLRMLAHLGIHFVSLGPQVLFHGERQPCYSDVDKLLAMAWAERRDVWQFLTRNGSLWPVNHQLLPAAA